MKKTLSFLLLIFIAAFSGKVSAQVGPIPATGYNTDVVANGVGTMASSTTGIFDNDSYVFLSKDWKLNSGSTPLTFGLPVNGVITSSTIPGLTYQIPTAVAPYQSNNSLRIATATPAPTGTLTVTNPLRYSKLYLLVGSGNGSSSVNVTVRFSDNSTQVLNNQTVPDWYQTGLPVEISGLGRGNRTNNVTESSTTNPKLFRLEVPIDLANQTKTVQSITITKTNTTGNSVFNLMALSGERSMEDCTGTPVAGTAQVNPISGAPNSGYTVSAQNYTAAFGLSFQ